MPIAYGYNDLYSLSKGVVVETGKATTNFKKPVTVNVPMTILREEDGDDTEIIAFRIMEDGSIEYEEDAEISIFNGIATYQVMGFSM